MFTLLRVLIDDNPYSFLADYNNEYSVEEPTTPYDCLAHSEDVEETRPILSPGDKPGELGVALAKLAQSQYAVVTTDLETIEKRFA